MSDLAIELHGVGKHYPFFRLDRIDLQVPHGQIMGLIGPNGAGKSTTIRILMGLVQQDCGEVRVLGRRMPAEQIAAKWDIGFASEDMRLYEGMTLAWHMNFIRSIYPNWDAPYAQLLLKRFGLRAVQTIKGLSHGQRVKATLLLVLARRPRLLVLDEPTTGLDPVARHEILKELTAVMTDEGRSVLFSSHNTRTWNRSPTGSRLSTAAASSTPWTRKPTWTGGVACVWKCRPEWRCRLCPASSESARTDGWPSSPPTPSRPRWPTPMRAPARG